MKHLCRVLCVLGLSLGGCASSGRIDPRLYGQTRACLEEAKAGGAGGDVLEVTFLGVAGFIIRRGGDAVLTAPLFTNPTIEAQLLNKPIPPRPGLIDAGLPTSWVADVRAILVGHSHSDHLMDVPHVANTKARQARIYGSKTMTHLIARAMDDPARLVSLNPSVDYRMCPGLPSCTNDNHGQAGDWVQVSGDPQSGRGVRVRALCSRHSRQLLGLQLWRGCADADQPVPETAKRWIMGDTFAYLIDFLQDGQPVFRVYFQDSAADPTEGYVHASLLSARPVDLAILCGGNFREVRDNPAGILRNLNPKHILIGHWDNFFKPLGETVEALPAHSFETLIARLEAATGAKPWQCKYALPAPGMTFRYGR